MNERARSALLRLKRARRNNPFYVVLCSIALVLSTLLVAGEVLAATPPEVCGSGLDEDSSGTYGSCAAGSANTIISTGTMSGCDLLCPGPDKDHDGFTTSTDADDTNRLIFPGVTYLDTTFKTNNSDGSITNHGGTALTDLPTGAHTYYIDCDTGSGTTCSAASPCGTLGMIAGGSPGSPPASAKTLVAGDRVWWKGTCTTTYNDGTSNVHANLNQDGSSGSPIIIHAIPGATAKINLDGANEYGFWVSGDYITFIGGEYYSSTSPVNPVFRIAQSTGVKIEGTYQHDLIGSGDNNFSAIYAADASAFNINRNVFVDISGTAATNADGKNAIIVFGDPGVSVTGGSIKNNVMSSTRATNSSCAVTDKCYHGIRFKHGLLATEVTGTYDVHYNQIIWPYNGIYIYSTSDVSAKYNLIVEPDVAAFRLSADPSGGNNGELQGIVIQRNTVVNGQALIVGRDVANTTDTYSLSENVFVDTANPYSAGADDGTSGIFMIQRYDGDEYLANALVAMTSNSNCFYNAAATLNFNFLGGGAILGTEGGSSADGMLTFAQWQSNTSEDASSFSENPTFDSYYRATATNCASFGWLLTSEESAGGGGGGGSTSGFVCMGG